MNTSNKNTDDEAEQDQMDLIGKLCPFAVMYVVREVDKMQAGETKTFLVDDPLATKSVREELDDYEGVQVEISKLTKAWAITVSKD